MKILIILIFCLFYQVCFTNASVVCEFDFSSEPPVQGPYSCILKVTNNESSIGDIDAQNILGNHLADMSDNDVDYVAIANNPSIDSIPKNLFKRFRNMEQFACFNTSLRILKKSYFGSTKSVKILWLHNNQIESIEKQCFSGLENLEQLILSNNYLISLNESTFEQMNVLTDLYLDGSLMEKLNANIFIKLISLYRLSLVRNKIKEIDEETFTNLTKLQVLYLDHNEIEELSLNVFKPLKRLNMLSLNNNLLTFIDKELFDAFEKLSYVEIRNNKLKHIDFIAKLPKLVVLDLSYNQIKAIEKFDLSTLENLKEINLIENFCANKYIKGNFSDELSVCFKNYQIPECKFYIDKNGYMCEAIAETMKNPNLIYDHHNIGYNNENVKVLKVNKINEDFSLSLLYERFKFLTKIYISKSKVNGLLEQSLNCKFLKTIDYRFIKCKSIKNNFFSSCQELENLFILKSNLGGLSNELFDGMTNLKFIDFSYNELVNDDLYSLHNLSSLFRLHLSANYISDINESIFENMKKLEVLKLDNNKIHIIHKISFKNLLNLRELHLEHNGIEEIANFEANSKLVYLNLENNQLTKIVSFLPSRLQYIDVSFNKIKELNATLFASMKRLNNMMMIKNACIDVNIKDIQFLSLNITMYLEKCSL